MKTQVSYSIFAAFLILFLSCSNDDDTPAVTINASAQTFELNGTNNCNTSLGTGSTFVMTIPYTASNGVSIERLQIDTRVSDGGIESGINTQFTDNGSSIVWATCFRFGTQDWVEFEVRLEGNDGSVSNISSIRINKPNGAE